MPKLTTRGRLSSHISEDEMLKRWLETGSAPPLRLAHNWLLTSLDSGHPHPLPLLGHPRIPEIFSWDVF